MGVTLLFSLAILISFASAKDHENIVFDHEEVVADLIQDADNFEHSNPENNDIKRSIAKRDANQFICRPNGFCVEVPPVGEPFCTAGPFGTRVGCECIDNGKIDANGVVC